MAPDLMVPTASTTVLAATDPDARYLNGAGNQITPRRSVTVAVQLDSLGRGIPAMALFKSGDLVTLKSGGPVMTVDTVNTDIFDDDKMTGVLCVWFVGEKLERVRFDHRAVEPAPVRATIEANKEAALAAETNAEYRDILDNMVDAMNTPVDAPATEAPDDGSRLPAKRRRIRSPSESRPNEGSAIIL
jgi:uncharacterized protein YodC (DUF2158 family)